MVKRRDKDAWLLLLALAIFVGLIFIAKAWSGHQSPVLGAKAVLRPWSCHSIPCMSQPKLERTARRVATHGGVAGSCYGCATHYMKLLADELVVREFPGWSEGWAVCVVERESGFNPGAVNWQSGATGLSQIEPQYHPEFNRWRLKDPVYGTHAFGRLSRWGRDRSPWAGGGYAC